MPTFDLLFVIAISIMAVSVFLAIIDWIYLASLGSKTTLLEREVEKKSLEFDAIKKERYNIHHSTESSASVIESSELLQGNTSLPPMTEGEDTIQIVRNVRGSFERTEQSTHNVEECRDTPPAPGSPIQPQSADANRFFSPHGSLRTSDGPDEESVQSGSSAFPEFEGVFDEAPLQTNQSDSYILKLYSETTRDADFQTLWKEITAIFQARQRPSIILDLAGINFMYDKEMDYLEKIKYLLAGQGGSFGFINCDNELRALFNNRPELQSIIQQKAV